MAGSLQIGVWMLEGEEGPLEKAFFDLMTIPDNIPLSMYASACASMEPADDLSPSAANLTQGLAVYKGTP